MANNTQSPRLDMAKLALESLTNRSPELEEEYQEFVDDILEDEDLSAEFSTAIEVAQEFSRSYSFAPGCSRTAPVTWDQNTEW